MKKDVLKMLSLLLSCCFSLSLLTSCSKTETLVDFSKDFSAVTPVGTDYQPAQAESVSLGRTVLNLWLTDFSHDTGFSISFSNLENMTETEVLSLSLLLQQSEVAAGTVALVLTGTDLDGKALEFRSEQEIAVGGWETLRFSVNSFFSSADPYKPCTLSILVRHPDTGKPLQTLLWLDTMTVESTVYAPAFLLPTAVASVGVLLGCTTVLLAYRTFKRKESSQ